MAALHYDDIWNSFPKILKSNHLVKLNITFCILTNLEELSLRTVLAFPNAKKNEKKKKQKKKIKGLTKTQFKPIIKGTVSLFELFRFVLSMKD